MPSVWQRRVNRTDIARRFALISRSITPTVPSYKTAAITASAPTTSAPHPSAKRKVKLRISLVIDNGTNCCLNVELSISWNLLVGCSPSSGY